MTGLLIYVPRFNQGMSPATVSSVAALPISYQCILSLFQGATISGRQLPSAMVGALS